MLWSTTWLEDGQPVHLELVAAVLIRDPRIIQEFPILPSTSMMETVILLTVILQTTGMQMR